MRRYLTTAMTIAAILAILPEFSRVRAEQAKDPPPLPSGVTERVEKRLVQVDVEAEGDAATIRQISPADLTVYIGSREAEGLIVDPMCGEEPQQETASGDVVPEQSSPPPRVERNHATYLFYFDQPHLTQAGRLLSLETAHDLILRLISGGSRAAIASDGLSLQTIVPMTSDRERLLAGLEKLRGDPKQWDSYADAEPRRRDDILYQPILRYCEDCGPRGARARVYAREELMMVRRSGRRLEQAMAALGDVAPPKALVYFDDTLREKAGLHFLHLATASSSEDLTPAAASDVDSVINAAVSRGVHFFTIQGEGLVPTFPGWDAERHRHAQDTLVGLAAETGGEAFLGGASPKFIGDRIAARTSCGLLLSFPPGDLPRDTPLAISIALRVPGVKLHAQGRVVIPSEASLERARLLAAFVDPGAADDGSLRVLLVPKSCDGERWHAEMQLRLRPGGYPGPEVELGGSLVRGDVVRQQFSSLIATSTGKRPTVLLADLDLSPGPFTVVAVARELKRGDLVSSRLEASWPDPSKEAASIAPIAVLQSGLAAISHDGKAQLSGSLARDIDESIDPTSDLVLATVACRGKETKRPVVVERWIEGAPRDLFAPVTLSETGDACAQIVDVVRAPQLRNGEADYRVIVKDGEEILSAERRTLRVGSGKSESAAAAPR